MHKAGGIAVSLLCLLGSAHAMEIANYQQGCISGKGAAAPLRQTIIVLDEASVEGTASSHGGAWKQPLLAIADAVDATSRGSMLPHEHLTIYLARQTGTELAPVFSGCSPNISDAQREQLNQQTSFWNWAFTGGAAREMEQARSSYKDALADAVRIIEKEATAQPEKRPGALLRSLATSPHLVDLSLGIPRILLVSPLNLADNQKWGDERAAREAGFELGANSGIDLQRAELHIIATRSVANQHLRGFVEAFFLRSRGFIAGWRTDGIPQLLPPPVDVKVFGGAVEMGEITPPVQIRIAFDSQGTLVNSWIEITKGRSLATPISGKAICRSKDACEIKGDGSLLGQAWNPDRNKDPAFNEQFAWSGLRYFEMSYSANSGKVRIWDPNVRIRIGDKQLEDFKFNVDRTEKQQF